MHAVMTYLHTLETVSKTILGFFILPRIVKARSHIAVPGEGALRFVEDDHPIQLVLAAKALLPLRGIVAAREHLAPFELAVVVRLIL
jgi:hypothetical protein